MTARIGWSAFGLVVIPLLLAGMILPAVSKRSDCGGNSAALGGCKSYVLILQLWGENHRGQGFCFEKADEQTQRQLACLPGNSWNRSARFLARLDDVHIDPTGPKCVLMVCDRPYYNVPRRRFGKSPMAHAVAYSTGETGLISPQQFAQLDLRGLVDLQSLPQAPGSQPAHSNPPPAAVRQ